MRHLLLPVFLLSGLTIYGQTPQVDPEYKRLVEAALAHFQKNECQPCLELYLQAFDISRHSPLSQMRAAACAHLCGETIRRDELIATAVGMDWDLCEQILKWKYHYPELDVVRGSSFEEKTKVEIQRTAEAANINFSLKKELEQIHHDDQKYRLSMDSVLQFHARSTPGYKAFQEEWIRQDSINVIKIEAIFAKFGYPGKSLVGSGEASTGYLVIQHAPLEKQEKYLPLITEAAQKGECPKSNWAYLIDRINMRKKLPQIYGSQVVSHPVTGAWIFHPIEDEANVNVRRAEVGLSPLEEYAKMMGVDWKLPEKKD